MGLDDHRGARGGAGVREALLVVGEHGSEAEAALALGAMRQISQLLLAAAEAWRVRRLAPNGGPGALPDRLNVKRHLDALVERRATAALLVIAGAVVATAAGPALLAGPEHDRYPDDATLPLAWIAGRLGAAMGERVIVLALQGDPALAQTCRALLAAAPAGPALIVVSIGVDAALATVAGALAGAAIDPTTGTVTRASLGRYLAAALPTAAIAPVDDRATLITPPPLGRVAELEGSRSAHAVAPALPASDLAGVVLPGRFRIERELARGTFGTVYRARQLTVGRDVAVKVLHDEIDPTSADGRLFLQEIDAVGRIDHANVVRIYQADLGFDGRVFFAMELLPGRTLAELAEAGPLSAPRAVALVGQLLAGLAAAHDAGLVHADVKPANAIVVEARGGERVVLVDFGVARLRRAGEATDSAGGTPAYMAPEQLHEGRVDARSDLFAAALVLVTLLTGWRRRRAADLVPPLDAITDPALRAVLARALALDPAARYPSAGELAAALRGERHAAAVAEQRPPFRRLASFTEADRDRLFGRARELAELAEHAMFRRAVVLMAPSGTGKTSLLRAALVPHLGQLGAEVVYASSRTAPIATITGALAPGSAGVVAAIAARRGKGRVVLVIDQLEALLGDTAAAGDPLSELLALERWAAADVGVVLAVREDFVGRLLARRELADAGVPVMRLGPIDLAGAREALVRPLAARRLALAPALLETLLGDLAAAAATLGPELGWTAPGVFPPHLQLAGAVLFDSLAPDEAVLTPAHYARLGGLEAIIGEHLERVLDTELDPPAAKIARGLFLALVTSSQARAARTELELLEVTSGARADVLAVLEVLRGQSLLVRTQRAAGEPVWELVHDSLVPRIQGWIDRQDLARRRAVEQVRYHLRRSRADAPSLLSRADLRDLDAHPDALAELHAEHVRRVGAAPWTPTGLVTRSRQIARRTTFAAVALGASVVAVVGYATYDRLTAAAAARREQSLRDRDMGRVVLQLRPFDGDGTSLTDVAPAALPALRWSLHEPAVDDPSLPGERFQPDRVLRPIAGHDGRYPIEASGGAAFLVVDGRARPGAPDCGPSVIPLRALPGYGRREQQPTPTLAIRVPSCVASAADQIAIPAGPYARGDFAPRWTGSPIAPGSRVSTPFVARFAIDRTEVTNRAYDVFSDMVAITGIARTIYADTDQLYQAGQPDFPVASVTWSDARAYCAFIGRRLPTSDEWYKALRGGLTLADGRRNPQPFRALPWGAAAWPGEPAAGPAEKRANIKISSPAPTPVGSYPDDRSPDGVLDLAGNVSEWTGSRTANGLMILRGGNWAETTPDTLALYAAIENPRPGGDQAYMQGFRCVR